MEQEHDKAEGEELSELEKDTSMMISDLDKLPSASKEEMAESRRTFEKIYDKILSSKTESFKPSLVRENDPAKSYLGYPHKVLEVLKEEGVDRIRARILIHHLPELKLFKLPLPSAAKDLSSQPYLPASVVQEFVKGSKIRALRENRNKQKHSFINGKRALDRLILVPEIILFERAKNYCEDEQNKGTFKNQVFYPSDITAEGDAKSDTYQGQNLQKLGVQVVYKFAEWLKSEQRAVQTYVALSSNIILIALDYPIEKDLFADRSNVTKLRKAIDNSNISVCSVYSGESASSPSIQSGKSSQKKLAVERGDIMESVQQQQSSQNQNRLSFNLIEIKSMLEKKITKSRLQQLIEEVNSIKAMEAKVKETFVEKTRQKHLKILDKQESDLKAQLEKVQEKRKEEEKKVLDDDPEVEEFTAPLKKVKKLEEQDNFNKLCKLMEDSQYEKLTARIEDNQLITHDIENQISKLRQELERVNADTVEATNLFSSTEFCEYLNTIEKSRQCYKCLQSEGYTLLVYSQDCPHRLCDKCANIQLDQVENKNYATSLVGYEYPCLLCDSEASTIQRKIFGVVIKN
jgi:hypothetical protein